jgi:DNA repair exonuclease SbcCD ATPase subunit
MSERIRLKTELQSRKFRIFEIAREAKKKIESIKDLLAASSITPLGDIDCDLVYELAKQLKFLKDEYSKLSDEIEKINRELND